MPLPASPPAPTLGLYDRCARCHQACDSDVPCPNCGHDESIVLVPGGSLDEALRFEVVRPSEYEGQEVLGHLILSGSCAYCEASLEYALAHWCVGR